MLDQDGIHLLVRAGGSEQMTIAQVQVDDAYWTFTQDSPGRLARFTTAWLHIPYPWVQGEAHRVKVVTRTGVTFEHEIAVAVATPTPDPNQMRPQALVGALVGILPVTIGLMFYPLLRRFVQTSTLVANTATITTTVSAVARRGFTIGNSSAMPTPENNSNTTSAPST